METLDLVGLRAKAGTRGSDLSGGQRRRLDVALALIGDPELVFLDEPTTGFDPSARRQAWEVVEGLRSLGKTIFLTTHYMDEAERLADRIMVVAGGLIVAEGPPSTLGNRDSRPAAVAFVFPSGADPTVLASAPFDLDGPDQDGRVSFATRDPIHDVARLAAWSDGVGILIRDLEVQKPTLEDIYLELTAAKPMQV